MTAEFKDQTKIRWVNCANCNEFTEENKIATSRRARTICQKCVHGWDVRHAEWNQIKDMTYRELSAQDDWEYNEKHYGDEESS